MKTSIIFISIGIEVCLFSFVLKHIVRKKTSINSYFIAWRAGKSGNLAVISKVNYFAEIVVFCKWDIFSPTLGNYLIFHPELFLFVFIFIFIRKWITRNFYFSAGSNKNLFWPSDCSSSLGVIWNSWRFAFIICS